MRINENIQGLYEVKKIGEDADLLFQHLVAEGIDEIFSAGVESFLVPFLHKTGHDGLNQFLVVVGKPEQQPVKFTDKPGGITRKAACPLVLRLSFKYRQQKGK